MTNALIGALEKGQNNQKPSCIRGIINITFGILSTLNFNGLTKHLVTNVFVKL
ncbi:hypothetical protein Hdeb2414_s0003g00086551 [Helianthus debilis subsp. tardiflorus]